MGVEVRTDGLAIRRANNAALPVLAPVEPKGSSGGKGGRGKQSRGRGHSAKGSGKGNRDGDKAGDANSSARIISDLAAADAISRQEAPDAHAAVEPDASALPGTRLVS